MSFFFDQNRTVLAGVPRATLTAWQAQLQAAVLNVALGSNPLSLSYSQGDGSSKTITHNIVNQMQAQFLLQLVNRCLGLPPARRPMRPFYR
jgi:hypothetical protein